MPEYGYWETYGFRRDEWQDDPPEARNPEWGWDSGRRVWRGSGFRDPRVRRPLVTLTRMRRPVDEWGACDPWFEPLPDGWR